MRCHLPPTSFTGYLSRCESCVMPCSRIEAPLAQCEPRLIGESNTGSWRTHTPFSTTASMAQPTEQCVQTVRLTSTFLSPEAWALASWTMLNGSWEATAPAPMVTPERFRNVRRSIVFASTPDNPRARRDCGAAAAPAFLVSSMACLLDLCGPVVVVDVLADLVAARGALAATGRWLLRGTGALRRDGCGGRGASGADGQKEISPGETPGALLHRCLLVLFGPGCPGRLWFSPSVLPDCSSAKNSRAFRMPYVQSCIGGTALGRRACRSSSHPRFLLQRTKVAPQARSSARRTPAAPRGCVFAPQ